MNRMISPCDFGHVLEHGLEAFLELAAVLGPGDQRAHVQGDDALALQALRHVLLDDALGQALDDGGFADAGFADQHRVVLGAPRQHLHDAADFVVAADDRVELVVAGVLRQVAAVFLQRLERPFRVLRRDALAAAHRLDRLQQLLARQAELAQDGVRRALVAGHGEQQGVGGNELVLQALGLFLGPPHQPFAARRDIDRVGRNVADARQLFELSAHAILEAVERGAGLVQHLGSQAVLLLQQGQQDVLHVNLLLAELDRQLLGGRHGFPGLLGKAIQIHRRPSLADPAMPCPERVPPCSLLNRI